MITDWDVYPDQQRFIGLLGYLMHRQDSERIVRLLSCVDENWFVDKDLKCLYQAFFLHAMQMDADNKRVSLSGVLTAAEQASQEHGWAQPLWASCNERAGYVEFDVYEENELPTWWQKLKRPKITNLLARVDQALTLPPSERGMIDARETCAKALAEFDALPDFQIEDKDTFSSLRDFVLEPRPCNARVSTGLDCIDLLLGGGLSGVEAADKGKLIIICARPGAGKTLVAVNVGMRVAAAGIPVAMWSLEMGVRQIKMRVLAAWDFAQRWSNGDRDCTEQVTFKALRDHGNQMNGFDTNWSPSIRERLASENYESLEQNFKIYTGGVGFTPEALCARMRLFARQNPDCRLFIIDHLGLLQMNGANRANAIGEATRMIKVTATELGIDVLLLCQLNRSVEDRNEKMPLLRDLRDSGRIEEDADAVMGLHRPAYYNPEAPIDELQIAMLKNRQGNLGNQQACVNLDCCAVYDVPLGLSLES